MSEETCEFPAFEMPGELVLKILKQYKTIAVVGLSTDPEKPAHYVPKYLKEQGYTIIPVHPKATEILGQKAYPSLDAVPVPIDVVNVFRPPSELPGIVDAAIRVKARAVWAQEGIVHNESADKARAAGLDVIMGLCMLKEHKAMVANQ